MNSIINNLLYWFFAQNRVAGEFEDLHLFVFEIYSFCPDESNNILLPLQIVFLTVSRTVDQLYMNIRSMNWKSAKLLCLNLLEGKIFVYVDSSLVFSVQKCGIVLFAKSVYQVLDKARFPNARFAAYHHIKYLLLSFFVWLTRKLKCCSGKIGKRKSRFVLILVLWSLES